MAFLPHLRLVDEATTPHTEASAAAPSVLCQPETPRLTTPSQMDNLCDAMIVDCAKWSREEQEEARVFISGVDHTSPLNAVWRAEHSLAVAIRDANGFVAVTIGCFGEVQRGEVTFSVYGTRVRQEGKGLGELIVRVLEVGVVERCAVLGATCMRMDLPSGQCHRKVSALLLYKKCGWSITHRKSRDKYEDVPEERLRELLSAQDKGEHLLEEAYAEHPGRSVSVSSLEEAKALVVQAKARVAEKAEEQMAEAEEQTAEEPDAPVEEEGAVEAAVAERVFALQDVLAHIALFVLGRANSSSFRPSDVHALAQVSRSARPAAAEVERRSIARAAEKCAFAHWRRASSSLRALRAALEKRQALVGRRVRVWWGADDRYYSGTIRRVTVKQFRVELDEAAGMWPSVLHWMRGSELEFI